MDTTIAVPRLELLQVADAVAREKGIERDEVLEAMEQAIQKAGRSKYGHEHGIRELRQHPGWRYDRMLRDGTGCRRLTPA